MMSPTLSDPVPQPRRSSVLIPLAVGGGAFAIGAALTFGYVQWQSQQQQMALMTQMVEQMRQQQAVPGAVARSAGVDLIGLPDTSPVTRAAPVAQPPVATNADPADQLGRSTADKIRALVARSSDPMVSAAIAQDVARRETMSLAIQGVNELVTAAVAGDYVLSAAADDRALRISFIGHEEDQAQMERLLTSAAEAGTIAFNASVRGADGSFNGRIILFDLVERALLNGTPEEQRTGQQIREEARALLGERAPVSAATQNASGERFYTVEAGDSVAYIALQFYGNTNAYLQIFNANRSVLSSPEKIQIGQRLVIPSA